METTDTIFAVYTMDNGRIAVTERLVGSRLLKFVASVDTRKDAEAWIAAACSSDYFETGLIFPSLREEAQS